MGDLLKWKAPFCNFERSLPSPPSWLDFARAPKSVHLLANTVDVAPLAVIHYISHFNNRIQQTIALIFCKKQHLVEIAVCT